MSRDSPRVVLVTGGSRGIGRAVALELGRHRYGVVVHARSNREAAEATAGEVRRAGGSATVVLGDLREPAGAVDVLRATMEFGQRLDGLVTAAGVYRGDASEEVGAEEWDQVIRVDLEGTFRTVQAALPALRASPGSSVITFSSILGSRPQGGGVAYQAAKSGVEQMTRALALELAPTVRVNCVAPGFIRTEMNRAGHSDPVFSGEVARATPAGRWGEPEDVAPAVRFLLDERSRWVTGSVLRVDGGLSLR